MGPALSPVVLPALSRHRQRAEPGYVFACVSGCTHFRPVKSGHGLDVFSSAITGSNASIKTSPAPNSSTAFLNRFGNRPFPRAARFLSTCRDSPHCRRKADSSFRILPTSGWRSARERLSVCNQRIRPHGALLITPELYVRQFLAEAPLSSATANSDVAVFDCP